MFQTSGGSPNSSPFANSIVPIAPSARMGWSVSSSSGQRVAAVSFSNVIPSSYAPRRTDRRDVRPAKNRFRRAGADSAEGHDRRRAANRGAIMDQRRLVEAAGQGDHDAFAPLARAAVVRLDEIARLVLRDPELARDAVQDAFFRAWRDLPGLRDPDRFDASLQRLTINSCLDIARRRKRRPIEVELMPPHAPAISDSAGAIADRALVEDILQRLDEHGRAIVVLHYYLWLPLTDVAAFLDVPVGTVKSRLHRAL